MTVHSGIPPAAQFAAGSGFDYVVLPKARDELGVGGAIQGAPLCTVAAYALADAEPVLEGYLHPRDKRYQAWEGGRASTSSTRSGSPHGQDLQDAVLASSQEMRMAAVVDEDVDTYRMDDVVWAPTPRVVPRTAILNPLPGGRGQTFMPAERMAAGEREWTGANTRFEGRMGIDATVPFGDEQDFHRPVYAVDRVDPADGFGSEAVARARDRMVGSVNSLARSVRCREVQRRAIFQP